MHQDRKPGGNPVPGHSDRPQEPVGERHQDAPQGAATWSEPQPKGTTRVLNLTPGVQLLAVFHQVGEDELFCHIRCRCGWRRRVLRVRVAVRTAARHIKTCPFCQHPGERDAPRNDPASLAALQGHKP